VAIEAIVLDFDGVVVESNRIKHEAFSDIFSDYPRHYSEMMRYHMAHNHVDRHAKFKYIIENILKQKYTEEEGKRLVDRFAGLTRKKIINAPYVTGALEFIKAVSDRYPIYIASATPLDELMIILKARGLTGYFAGVYGAPMPKSRMFMDIMKKEQILPQDILFIGDSPEDCNVASESGVHFLARTSEHKIDEKKARSFKDMKEIMENVLEGAK